MKKIILGVIAVAMLAIPTAAIASVTIDANGKGFVGKGDVQTALGGINNAQMQAQASSLLFTYVKTDTYQVINAWATGNEDNPVSLNSHLETVTSTVGVSASVAYDARQRNQVTGFNLSGWLGEPVITGTVPVKSNTVTGKTFTYYTNGDKIMETVACPTKNDPAKMCETWTGEWTQVPHVTDQMPVDEFGNLYTEGNNKAVLSVELVSSTGGLFVNGFAL